MEEQPTSSHGNAPNESQPVEGSYTINPADDMPPITVHWTASDSVLTAQIELDNGQVCSSSTIEIPFVKAPADATAHTVIPPASSASITGSFPIDEPPAHVVSQLTQAYPTTDCNTENSDFLQSRNMALQSLDEAPRDFIMPTERPRLALLQNADERFCDYHDMLGVPYGDADGAGDEGMGKRRRPKKSHRIRTIIIALVIAFVLYELGGIFIAPLVLPSSDAGAETLPSTFGQADGCSERIMYLGNDNEEALDWRLKVISQAQDEIFFESLDLRNDESSHDLMSALYAAADRGVHERIIVDGITGFFLLKLDAQFAELYNHPNVEVKFYNVPNLLTPWTLNYRLHEKVLMVDRSFAIIGGRNSMNYFLGSYDDVQKIDRDILVYNPSESSTVFSTISRHFYAYWNYELCTDASPWATPSDSLAAHWRYLASASEIVSQDADWTNLTYAVDDIAFITGGTEATNKEPTLWKSICSVAAGGTDVIIQTPYVMFSDEMYADLTVLGEGRSVSIVTNDITDHTNAFGTMDLTHERDEIIATGATLVETQWDSFVHAKAFVVDDDISLIGSFNCDFRSAYLDNECMLVIKSTTLNEQLRSEILSSLEKGYAQTSSSATAGSDYDMGKRNSNSVFWSIAGFFTNPLRYLF